GRHSLDNRNPAPNLSTLGIADQASTPTSAASIANTATALPRAPTPRAMSPHRRRGAARGGAIASGVVATDKRPPPAGGLLAGEVDRGALVRQRPQRRIHLGPDVLTQRRIVHRGRRPLALVRGPPQELSERLGLLRRLHVRQVLVHDQVGERGDRVRLGPGLV